MACAASPSSQAGGGTATAPLPFIAKVKEGGATSYKPTARAAGFSQSVIRFTAAWSRGDGPGTDSAADWAAECATVLRGMGVVAGVVELDNLNKIASGECPSTTEGVMAIFNRYVQAFCTSAKEADATKQWKQVSTHLDKRNTAGRAAREAKQAFATYFPASTTKRISIEGAKSLAAAQGFSDDAWTAAGDNFATIITARIIREGLTESQPWLNMLSNAMMEAADVTPPAANGAGAQDGTMDADTGTQQGKLATNVSNLLAVQALFPFNSVISSADPALYVETPTNVTPRKAKMGAGPVAAPLVGLVGAMRVKSQTKQRRWSASWAPCE